MTNPKSFDSPGSPQNDTNAGGQHDEPIYRDKDGLIITSPPTEKAILVGLELSSRPDLMSLEDSLTELALLARTAGVRVVGSITQRLDKPNSATLIGSGKVEELHTLVLEQGANVVIFDDELSPRQQRELENVLGQDIKVLDRTALILDIFARHARTREGSVQVELAQYEYRLPRLTRAWTHLARQAGGRAGGAGGGVGVRGPGETQLEADRREIGRRIAFLKRQLTDISRHRDQYRKQRRRSSTPVVSLVGYTNAGKSTLLNALTDSHVLAENQLFATLDPTTRRMDLPSGHTILLTDTVGFIQKLPTELVAAFRATLEEVTEAEILVHVVDVSHTNVDEQVAAVEEVLEDLGAGDKTIITALNKIDLLDRNNETDRAILAASLAEYPNAVAVSAITGEGLDDLRTRIDEMLRKRMVPVDVLIPYAHGELVSLAHDYGFVESEEHTESGTHLQGRLPVELAGRYVDYWVDQADESQQEAN